MLDDDSDGHGHLGCSRVVRVLKQVPEVSLGGGAGARPEVLLLLLPVLRVRQQPPDDNDDHNDFDGDDDNDGNDDNDQNAVKTATWLCSRCAGSRAPGAGHPGPSTLTPHRNPESKQIQ